MFAKAPSSHKKRRICSATLVLALILAGFSRGEAKKKEVSPKVVSHSGYSDCIELINESTRVVLCPAAGGRVLEYSLGGKNSLYLDPKQDGWVYKPGKGEIDPWGGRFDIGPEKIVPKHPDLWLGKWTSQIMGARSAKLISVEDEATGVQLIREFVLDKTSSRLMCTQIIKNVSDRTTGWCHWSRTMAVGGGICLIPLTEPSRFPAKYVMYGPGSVINFAPKDANIRVRDGFLEILDTPKEPKLGMDSYAGWFCYLMKNDLMFVKRFVAHRNRVYNEMAGLTISIWYNKDIMCELEPIGPMQTLRPGQSSAFTEEWYLASYKFPTDRRNVNLEEVTEIAGLLGK